MVASHAARFDSGMNRRQLRRARRYVSCTGSSATARGYQWAAGHPRRGTRARSPLFRAGPPRLGRPLLDRSANITDAMATRALHPDLLVVGAGLAGLYAALHAARGGARVALVTKGALRASTSFHAQGGIAAAVGADDSPADHAADTMRVGRGLCDA